MIHEICQRALHIVSKGNINSPIQVKLARKLKYLTNGKKKFSENSELLTLLTQSWIWNEKALAKYLQ